MSTITSLDVRAPVDDRFAQILTPEALRFVESLVRELGATRDRLLARRVERQKEIDAGRLPDFLPGTEKIRSDPSWSVAPPPTDLQDRRVEITGPVDRKMVINALNSGASVFMADFEDANSPTWRNTVGGQVNLRDAIRRTITFESPEGKKYALQERTAVLMVRPRGWHLPEKHVLLDGKPIPGALFDFGLYAFHNARELLDRGTGPYFYLPKLESHLEARLWKDAFVMAEEALGLSRGSMRGTVLVETILAAFEMEEILYELRDHSAGLNCGRWDYIFSIIKRFRGNERFTQPDREQVTMTTRPMHSYSLLAIQTCHRRGAHAIGGMAAHIPVKDDPARNEEAFAKVWADKEREAGDGHDGTWVAHPGLVPVARKAFDERMPEPNQVGRKREDVSVTRDDLLSVPEGTITERGVRHNIDVGIQYMAAWLGGVGSVPIYNLMEDAATAEISRSQLWQWLHHGNARLVDDRDVTRELMHGLFDQELEKVRTLVGRERFDAGHYRTARELIEGIVMKDEFTEFMTSAGYGYLE